MAPANDQAEDIAADEANESATAQRRIGQLVAGVYRVTRYIGSGGSSHVYEVEHARLGKPFALKLLRPELDSSRKTAQRFRREAKAIARLQSEHVISVVDCGELEDQTPYLVMELLRGEDLRQVLTREGRLPARRAVHIAIEACRGLSEVHQAGLVHRDLKPENLFITRRSSGEDWCKVLDFGVAKMQASQSTAQGAIIGTVRYMAPEQLADGGAVGPTTDVYALGAILYECLAGVALAEGDSVQQVMYRVMNLEPTPLASLRPELPDALIELVEQCVAKLPADRPQSVDELATLLRESLPAAKAAGSAGTISEDASQPLSPTPRRRPPQGKPRALPVPLAAVALLAAAGAGWAVGNAGTVEPQTDRQTKATPERPPSHPGVSSPEPPAAPVSAAAALAPAATPFAPAAAAARPSGDSPELKATTLAPKTKAMGARRAPTAAPTAAGQGITPGRFDNANPYD